MTMQVRNIAALVALAFCMPTMASARQKTISFDPDQMEACEGDRPQGTPWQLPNVGVERNRLMPRRSHGGHAECKCHQCCDIANLHCHGPSSGLAFNFLGVKK